MRDIIKRFKVNLGYLVLINKMFKMRNINIFCFDLSIFYDLFYLLRG